MYVTRGVQCMIPREHNVNGVKYTCFAKTNRKSATENNYVYTRVYRYSLSIGIHA